MNKGVLLFAHNGDKVDYGTMSVVAGGIAKKNLKVPVSLVTDKHTVDWLKKTKIYTKAKGIFDQIIIVDLPKTENKRFLYDGDKKELVPFRNTNRCNAWHLTPYDRTLLIDCDYFILSDNYSEYWDLNSDLLVPESVFEISNEDRLGYHDIYISDTGVKMQWATAIMFTKNEKTKSFFDLVDYVKEEYNFYSDLFRFNTPNFRNDVAFSIAKHIFYGFSQEPTYSLPPLITAIDKDILYDININEQLLFLVKDKLNDEYYAAMLEGQNIHIMNKQSIIRNIDKFLEII